NLRQFLVLQLLEKHVGESFRGIVTGVNPRGVFVQIDKFLADGFIKSEDLPGDITRENLTPFWKVDGKTGALVDQRSGRSFNFGDSLIVRIANVDLAKRTLDLTVDDAASRAAGKARKAPGPVAGLAAGLGGGMTAGGGAGFGNFKKMSGSERRSQKSKQRDKGKGNRFRDK
ncbi:MAG: S1 RNA-binding domain-containing protein, partial [Phycisphaerales bacterium]